MEILRRNLEWAGFEAQWGLLTEFLLKQIVNPPPSAKPESATARGAYTGLFNSWIAYNMCRLLVSHFVCMQRLKSSSNTRFLGVINVAEVRRHTESYVRNVLFDDRKLPFHVNRRYYPTNVDNRNVIRRTRLEMAHSLIHEVNLAQKIHRWIEFEPDNKFFYRPSANSCDNEMVVDNENSDVQLHGSVSGFLLIHQTHWQQKLLAKYG